jgi:hypothetical protein
MISLKEPLTKAYLMESNLKIAYTVFHYDKYEAGMQKKRAKNVENIHAQFSKKFTYIENGVVMINDLDSYKKALKDNTDLRSLKVVGKMRFGAAGLIFTTFLAYKKMIDLDFDIFLFFEDDAQLAQNANTIVDHYLKELPKDFDIFSMYENKAFYSKYNETKDVGFKDICDSYNDISTLVYAISKKGLGEYFRLMKDKVDNPVDLFLFNKKLNTKKYSIKPTSPQPFYSDFFEDNGYPEDESSTINNTKEFVFSQPLESKS